MQFKFIVFALFGGVAVAAPTDNFESRDNAAVADITSRYCVKAGNIEGMPIRDDAAVTGITSRYRVKVDD